MIENHRVCLAIPAGRRRYMELLIPQLLREEGWDELQIWVNTTDPADVAYLGQLPQRDARIRLVHLPDGETPNGMYTIYRFFTNCIDPETVYIRIDDDVVYIEPGTIGKLVRFRLRHQQPFVVFPVIINNAIITHILQALGRIKLPDYVRAYCMDPLGWENPKVAEGLHRAFLKALENGDISRFKFGARPIALSRMSINCIAWLGSEFAKFGGILPVEEEEWLSVTKPNELAVPNAIFGGAVVAHFSFFTQRDHLDRTDILDRYRALIEV